MTVEEAATVLNTSVGTVRRYKRSGRLPAQRVQGNDNQEYRLHPQDVEDAHTVDRAGSVRFQYRARATTRHVGNACAHHPF